FYLRKGVKWHDGVEFTAEDVLFGFRLITDPHTPTAYAGDFLEVDRAEVLNRYTFRVHYRRPFAPALSSWGNLVVLPKHLLQGKDLTRSAFGRHPIGTGPFRFYQWRTQEKIVLEANPDYFAGRPYLNWIVFRVIPDPATMFMELKAGGIDWMDLTPLQFARETNTPAFRARFRKYKYLAFSYTYLGYNLRHPLFRDRRVRQALSYAINKQEIVEGVLFGLGVPATGPYKPDTYWYNPNVRHYPYDPEKARELLARAGWRDTDGDGVLDKDGHPFEFTILTNQGNLSRLLTAQIIQRRLSQIGLRVHIRTVEWTAFIHEFIDKRRFEAVILGWTTGPEPDLYDVWHSSKIKPPGLNFISYANPEVDRLLEAGRRTFDRQKRKRIYDRFQEILAEDQPYTFLYVPMALPCIHRRFHGIKPAPLGISYNLERWWVPRSAQKYLVP
ncbi:MAG: peptide-binding protein, partial [Thermodesulfatator sp.]